MPPTSSNTSSSNSGSNNQGSKGTYIQPKSTAVALQRDRR
jgi:hypothetical protein